MHRYIAWLAGASALVLSFMSAAAVPATASPPAGWATAGLPAGMHRVCAPSRMPGQMSCALLINGAARSAGRGVLAAAAPSGDAPSDLRGAYALQGAWLGYGQTVAVVDAYDDPNAAADLAVYRTQFGLPACTVATGCLTKVDESGGTNYPAANAAWAQESATDLDVVSAICPNCKILLVEANSASITDLGTAVNTAVGLGARFIDNSYFGPEDTNNITYDDTYFNHPGVAITASAGDSGYGVNYPAASQYVTSVGGTSVSFLAGDVRAYTETVWGQTGAGCSAYDAKPAWQTDTGCTGRTVADLSADADPAHGPAVYDSFDAAGWLVAGGTSVSSAIVAAAYALAGTPSSSGYPAQYPYAHHGPLTINDITSGSDGTCSITYLCTAGTGYDGPTGLGTLNGESTLSSTGTLAGRIYSGEYGLCLDDANGSLTAKNPVQVYHCAFGPAQSWTVEPDGTIQISGHCLDVLASGTAVGTKVDLYPCNNTGAQKWFQRADGTLVNPEANKCLQGSATETTQLVLATCSGTNIGQVWHMPYSIPQRTGSFHASFSSGLCVDDKTDLTTDKNPVEVYTCNSSAAQTWTMEPDGAIQLTTGHCLDVTASGSANGTKVDLYTCNGSGSEQWRYGVDHTLVNPESGKCLDDPGASTLNLTQLQIYTCNGNVQQAWVLQS